MARNGSGTMSIVNSFTASTTIESAKVNANFSDVASEITGSLPRDGQAAMTGQLKSASGTAAAPGVTFSSETSSGFYRSSAGVIGAAISGTAVATLESTGWKNASGVKYDAFASGTVLLFYQAAAPTGWTVSDVDSNKAVRIVSGVAGTGGTSGGTTGFTSVFTSRTIAQANLPNVTLTTTITDPGHLHTIPLSSTGNHPTGSGSSEPRGAGTTNTSSTTTGITASTSLGGSGTAMDFAVQYINVIKAAKD